MNPARTLAALVAVLLMGGCAMLPGAPARGVPAAEVGAPPADALVVEIDAPAGLRPLLERHLDLTRLGTLTRGDTVSDSEWSRLIDAAPAQVRELLQTEGHFEPRVRIERPVTAGQARPRVVMHVDPGPQVRVSRVTLEVEGELAQQAAAGDARARRLLEELRAGFPMPEGSAFRNEAWSAAKLALLTRLRSSGYVTAAWSGTAAQIDEARAGVRLFLVADSGPLFRSGEVEITGLRVHEEDTVRALGNFPPGTPITESLLLDYQERLQKSGLFEGITVTHDTDVEQAHAARIFVRLRERELQSYTLGAGYSTNTGPRATVEQVHRRLFGLPLRSRSHLQLGADKSMLDLEVSTHPQAGLYRNLGGLVVERQVKDLETVLSHRLRVGRGRDTVAREQFVFAELERGRQTTPAVDRTTVAVSALATLVLRDLDSVILPTQGYTLAVQGTVGNSHGNLSMSGPFARGYVKLNLYRPLGQAWYGQARVEAGHVLRRDGVGIPDSQLFRAGGDESVRGYGYRTLGPIEDGLVTGGTSLFTASLELARPFSASVPSLWGAAFIDAGRAANGMANLDPALGAGIGLRWRSPVGPLRLDWAWGEELRRARLHFSIGIAL